MRRAQWKKIGIGAVAVLLVAITGWTRSPLTFVLYLPVLLAAQRGRSRTGLLIGLLIAAIYVAGTVYSKDFSKTAEPIIVGFALSFPAVAVFSSLMNKRSEDRFHALNSRTTELSSLLDMSQMMDSAFDLDMTLNLILLNVQKASNCQLCAVYLKDEHNRLELKAASGPRDRVSLLTPVSVDEARCWEWSLAESSPLGQATLALYVPEVTHVVRTVSRLFDIDPRVRSFACIPLTCVEGLLGMLYVAYDVPNGLSPEGVERLENLGARASFPLQRVLLQQGFQSMAFSDAKTGLDNYRQFDQNLVSEMSRAERYGHKLSVILLDIDHFKKFNDTMGHPAGDALLAQLAVVLRNSLRGVDRPARFGGEEFVIICPETGKEEARLIAERIRQNVAETAFTLTDTENEASSGKTTHVTISLGFATFPLDAHSTSELVKNADAALYAAKDSGRNAVKGYEDISSKVYIG